MKPAFLEHLMQSSAYPEATDHVSLIQTHVSWIFLTDSHAYKIKKPVNFGFLDFSTIEKRRFYCHEELRLNRRLCPDMYEAIVELRDTPHGAAFHGEGAVIDYAVRMKRLPTEGMLSHLVEQNCVTVDDMGRIAIAISRFHRIAATSPEIAAFGSAEQIRFNWHESLEQLETFADSTLPDADRLLLADWVNRFIKANYHLFDARRTGGFIRECDGDIHLENICLYDQRIAIFDCIEFNERFRYCDTAADIAFLAMDLDFHSRQDLAQAVISAYCADSGDTGLPQLLTFYKMYRAVVRGKVESFRLLDQGIDAGQQELARQTAIRYLRLARGYLERARLRPTLFITCGLMGCGKSALAAQLGFELGIQVFSSDNTRKNLFCNGSTSCNQDGFGQGIYTVEHSQETYRKLARQAENALATGGSVIIDASFASCAERANFARLAGNAGARFVILHVTCDEQLQLQRLTERQLRGDSPSDGRPELVESQQMVFEPPDSCEGRLIFIQSIDRPDTLTNAVYQGLQP